MTTLPEEMHAEFERQCAVARELGFKPSRLLVCPTLYRNLGVYGSRPTHYHGVAVKEVNTWAWGWQLLVRNPALDTPACLQEFSLTPPESRP